MRKAIALGGWLAMALSVPAAAQDTSVQEVLDCMSAAVPEGVVILQDLRFETFADAEDDEAELLDARLHMRVQGAAPGGKRRLQAMMDVQAPDYLAGAAYLLREAEPDVGDAMYVYLPSVQRIRRVSGGFAETALMGTQFSYNDFRRWQGLFGDADIAYLARDERQGRSVHRLRLTDPRSRQSGYDRVDVAVDAEYCLIVQADFYAGDKLHKQLNVDAEHLRQLGHYWYPMRLTMQAMETGARTDLRVERIRARASVPDAVFDPARFHLAE